MGKLTSEHKKHIKKISKQFEHDFTRHMENQVQNGGSFMDNANNIATQYVNDAFKFAKSDEGKMWAVDKAIEKGLPIAIKILAGNIARINHIANLEPMTKEEVDYFEKNQRNHIHAAGFWDGFYDGFKSVLKPGLNILGPATGIPLPVGSLAFGVGDSLLGKGIDKRGGHRVAGSTGGYLTVAGDDDIDGSALHVAGAHRVAGKTNLGTTENSKPPKQYRQDYQRLMTPDDYI